MFSRDIQRRIGTTMDLGWEWQMFLKVWSGSLRTTWAATKIIFLFPTHLPHLTLNTGPWNLWLLLRPKWSLWCRGSSVPSPRVQDSTQDSCECSLGQVTRLHLYEDRVGITTFGLPAMPTSHPQWPEFGSTWVHHIRKQAQQRQNGAVVKSMGSALTPLC